MALVSGALLLFPVTAHYVAFLREWLDGKPPGKSLSRE